MDILIPLSIIAAFCAGYLLRTTLIRDLFVENAQLRGYLYVSRGYSVKPSLKPPKEANVITEDEEKPPSVNMKMPSVWGEASHKAPDYFEAKRRAIVADTQVVKEGKK